MLSPSTLTLLAAATALAAAPRLADAHGYVYQPAPTWDNGSPNVGWVAGIDYYWEEVGDGGDQVGIFKTMAAEKNMSVRDVLLEMAPDYPCGHTLEDGTQQDLPTDGKLLFKGNEGGGFTHQGPCEVWFDDTLALRGDNCENEYPGGAVGSTDYSELPVDYSLCQGDCVLRFYWLGFQNAMWQAYINCVPLKGSTSTSTATEAPATTAPATEAPATTAPATEAPVATEPATLAPTTEAPTTEAPETETPETEAPAATTAAPAATEETADEATTNETPVPSCVARDRRRRRN